MWKKPIEPETNEATTESAPKAPTPRAAPSGSSSIIGTSIVLHGDITGDEDLVVKGNVEGTLNLPNNNIKIDPEGEVKADLKAQKISVGGKVEGNLVGSERVVIEKSGQVVGNIVAPRVALEDGCKFKGSVEMNMDSTSKPTVNLGTSTNTGQSQAPKTDKASSSSGLTRASGTT